MNYLKTLVTIFGVKMKLALNYFYFSPEDDHFLFERRDEFFIQRVGVWKYICEEMSSLSLLQRQRYSYLKLTEVRLVVVEIKFWKLEMYLVQDLPALGKSEKKILLHTK